MAVTWIGVIKGSGISRAIDYVANPDKTTEDAFYSVNMEQSIEYAINPSKDVQRLYRTAINCSSVENACSEMMDTKQRFGKTEGGALGFHVVQSFKPGEIAPELAHRLGCELARRCFGNYEAIVGTHLDKAHIHNHIIVNSVSFVDGRKYHSHAGSYYHEIRKTSDALCREYGLSIVQDNGQSRGKIPYAQRKAEQAGKPTWDSALRSDIDYAISQSRSFEQWVYNLRNMGYAVKTNVKHLAVLPPGKQKFIRLRRLGEDYTEEGIRSRIKGNIGKKLQPPERELENPTAREYRPNVRRVRYRGSFPKCKRSRITGFMALYLWYAYRMGNKRKARPNNRRIGYFAPMPPMIWLNDTKLLGFLVRQDAESDMYSTDAVCIDVDSHSYSQYLDVNGTPVYFQNYQLSGHPSLTADGKNILLIEGGPLGRYWTKFEYAPNEKWLSRFSLETGELVHLTELPDDQKTMRIHSIISAN